MENLDPAVNPQPATPYGDSPPPDDNHTPPDSTHTQAERTEDTRGRDETREGEKPSDVTQLTGRARSLANLRPRWTRDDHPRSPGRPRGPSVAKLAAELLEAQPHVAQAIAQRWIDDALDPDARGHTDARRDLVDRIDGPVVKRVEQDTRSVALTAYHVTTGAGGGSATRLGSHSGAFQQNSNTALLPHVSVEPGVPVSRVDGSMVAGGDVGEESGTPVLSRVLDRLEALGSVLERLDARVGRLESGGG